MFLLEHVCFFFFALSSRSLDSLLPTTSMDASSRGGGRVCGHKDAPGLTGAHPGQHGHGHGLRGAHAHAVDGGPRAGGGSRGGGAALDDRSRGSYGLGGRVLCSSCSWA